MKHVVSYVDKCMWRLVRIVIMTGYNDLLDLAKYITEHLRESTTVDWQVRDSVRARLHNLVRCVLRRWNTHQTKQIELCLRQAEILSQSWSA